MMYFSVIWCIDKVIFYGYFLKDRDGKYHDAVCEDSAAYDDK